MAVNLRAAFLGTRYLVPLMTEGDAAIVNISSVHAVATSAGMAAYVSSKGGLLAFTRAAAIELADRGIRVNAVLPGAFDTPMLEAGLKRSKMGSVAARKNLEDRTPLKAVARPQAIAGAVAFLLDEHQSSFVTGQTLVVDGGVLARLSSE
jgi:NAD(P)-dependent dehydrogenase (short-subunit alcohol dehydrogenase family)